MSWFLKCWQNISLTQFLYFHLVDILMMKNLLYKHETNSTLPHMTTYCKIKFEIPILWIILSFVKEQSSIWENYKSILCKQLNLLG